MNKQNKILVLAPSHPKSSEAWMTRMTDMLLPDVEFVAMQGGQTSKELQASIAPILPAPPKFIPSRLFSRALQRRANLRLIELLESRGPETAVLCHYLTTAVYFEKAWQQVPNRVFVHCHGHDVTWDRKAEFLPIFNAHPIGYVSQVKRIAKRVTLIANSKATMQKLGAIGISEDCIRLKYLGVEIPDPVPIAKPRLPLQILYLGRLTDFKGPLETIAAFEKAVDDGLDAKLIMAGTGHQNAACKRRRDQSPHSDRIELLGAVPWEQAAQLLRASDIFTAHNKKSEVTGQEEAFGVSIVEAMAFGIPVVTGRSGGVCETVVDQVTGYLFTPGDVNAHAKCLLNLGNDPHLRRQLGNAGRERAKALFSLEAEKSRLLDILSGV